MHKEIIDLIDSNLKGLRDAMLTLEDRIDYADKLCDIKTQANYYSSKINEIMDIARGYADKLELLCDKKEWPFPNYADILFYE